MVIIRRDLLARSPASLPDTFSYAAMEANCVSRWLPIGDVTGVLCDLRRIRQLSVAGVPLTPEARLQPGHTEKETNTVGKPKISIEYCVA